ncbi:unnamed protein product [Miscanthus lutarioriparius]|uniref:Uncharacterized protein n=1 Tax=Miscanthus lutarioriparius TaxID=422564 RepID=A0A811RRF5_9POAL|nr:unnamed protein product [Miscanthus lutarioriparius]
MAAPASRAPCLCSSRSRLSLARPWAARHRWASASTWAWPWAPASGPKCPRSSHGYMALAEMSALAESDKGVGKAAATFGFSSIIGTGVFVLMGQEVHDHVGPTIVLSYIASGLSAKLSVFCYTEFVVEIPMADDSFAYLRVELNDAVAFIATANLILESVIGMVAVARSWTSYLASLINKPASMLWIHVSRLAKGYDELDPIAVVVIAVNAHYQGYLLHELGRVRRACAIYCIMALVLSMRQPYTAIDRSATYSVAFASVGMQWAQYVVVLGALKGMTIVLLVGALGQACYTTHIVWSHIIPPVFALVHPRTGTPMHATALIAVCSAYIALFSSLDILSSLLFVSTVLIFMMMATALLVQWYYVRGVMTQTHALWFTTLLLLIIVSSIGIAAYWGTSP